MDIKEIQEFIFAIEDKYNLRYTAKQKVYLSDYLKNFNKFYLKCLFRTTQLEFSGQYGRLPDEAIFEKMKTQIFQSAEYQSLVRKENNRGLIEENSEKYLPKEVCEQKMKEILKMLSQKKAKKNNTKIDLFN